MNEFSMYFAGGSRDREYLTMEIHYREQRLCEISVEQGLDQPRIEFLTDLYLLPESVRMEFSFDEFEAVLQEARRALVARYR